MMTSWRFMVQVLTVAMGGDVERGGEVDSCPLSPNKSTSGDSSGFPNKMSSSPNNPLPEDFF